MSDIVFDPSILRGLTFSSYKTPQWGRRVQRAVSGRELVVQDYANPIWTWRLQFSFLRDYPTPAGGSELRFLMDWYNSTIAAHDTFLYKDRDDFFAEDQPQGIGDGVVTVFPLYRYLYPYFHAERVFAPYNISEVSVGGVPTLDYAIDTNTGIITFPSPPAVGALITSSFQFYFRCRLVDDGLEFERFAHQLWTVKELRFRSVVL